MMRIKKFTTSIMIPLAIKFKVFRITNPGNHEMPSVFIKEKIMPVIFRLKELRTVNVCNRVVNHLEPLTKE